MRNYETVVIFEPHLEEEKRNQILDRLTGILSSNGEITNIDEWGTRKLAYEINDLREGYYYIINFKSTPETVTEFDRIAKITDSIIRHMVVRDDE